MSVDGFFMVNYQIGVQFAEPEETCSGILPCVLRSGIVRALMQTDPKFSGNSRQELISFFEEGYFVASLGQLQRKVAASPACSNDSDIHARPLRGACFELACLMYIRNHQKSLVRPSKISD